MSNQAYIFGIFILNGFIIGILFDMFRSFRKILKTPDFITYIEDVIFWILTGIILLFTIFTFNKNPVTLRSIIYDGQLLSAYPASKPFSFCRYSGELIKRTRFRCHHQTPPYPEERFSFGSG